ncbi:MAG: hypothetical protein QF449_05135 [Alphaproteobacteria bacterium]|jgi:hypothetical protein|nr:hypothetical protein [Alphaproteobacteria bacterium]MDP6817407.1 hypothetical protein [Alphaproteobacteria bacterium]
MFSKAIFQIGLMALAMMALAMMPGAGLATEPTGPSAPVRLEIVNATAAPHLLCRLVLAHFVTEDLAPIGAGDEAVIELRRDADDGTLIYRPGGGRRMAVENILCGLAGNWQASRADLNLAELRGGQRAHLRITCERPQAFSCKARGRAE